MVSIPLWFDSNICHDVSPCTFFKVSIPLWFDSNYSHVVAEARGKLKFQFHSGSIQTRFLFNSKYSITLFQFHSGSIQTFVMMFLLARFLRFQFHSGSIQTTLTSLPKRAASSSFNSTLVRFKHVFFLTPNTL